MKSPIFFIAFFIFAFWTLSRNSALKAGEAQSKELLKKMEGSKGILLLVGEAGSLAQEIAQSTEFTILVQHEQAKEIAKYRSSLDSAGLLGNRVTVQQGDYSRLHLADDLADAVVVLPDAKVSSEEVLRVLRPKGKGIVSGKILTKDFRAGTDEWSHPYHLPDNNPQSSDALVRRPFMTHYMAEPWYCPLPMMSVISGGRVFKVFGDRSSAKPQEVLINKLLAMNAFNGTILWQRDL